MFVFGVSLGFCVSGCLLVVRCLWFASVYLQMKHTSFAGFVFEFRGMHWNI